MKESASQKAINVWKTTNYIEQPKAKENIEQIVEQITSLFTAGSYYYFIFNFHTLKFDLIGGNLNQVLGYQPENMTLDFFFSLMHSEDLEKYHEKEKVGFDFLINHIPTEDISLYKVVYLLRIKHLDGFYKTIMHQSKAINVSEDGKVHQVLCVQTDLTHLNTPMDHSISFISDTRPSYFSVATKPPYTFKANTQNIQFSKREKHILKELALGNSINEIAKKFNISIHTVSTHRKNVLKKSGCHNMAQLITKSIREGVI